MTQEERELLLKDLCARLPYGVKVPYDNQACKLISMNGDNGSVLLLGEDGFTKPDFDDGLFIPIEKIKPYLRPLSSMSADEIYSVAGIVIPGLPHDIDEAKGTCSVCCHNYTDEIEQDFSVRDLANGIYGIEGLDWLNEHHFDFRNLIGRGLAIDCTDLNIY